MYDCYHDLVKRCGIYVSHICSVCLSHNPDLRFYSKFYERILINSNTTGTTSGKGTGIIFTVIPPYIRILSSDWLMKGVFA
jgi:hypothetical protein